MHRWVLMYRLLRHTQRSHRQTHLLAIRSAASCNPGGRALNHHGAKRARARGVGLMLLKRASLPDMRWLVLLGVLAGAGVAEQIGRRRRA